MEAKIFVALPIDNGAMAQWWNCLMAVALNPPEGLQLHIKQIIGDSLVCRARNTLSSAFLDSDCTHLLFIDSDLVFSAEHIARLVNHNVEVVAGFYPKKCEGPIQWVCNALPEQPPADPETGLQSVRYMGTGFMLIQRGVFEKMRKKLPIDYKSDIDGKTEWDFWPVGPYRGADGTRRYLSEDWYFCQRCLDLGIPVYGDTKVVLKHMGFATYPLQSQEPELCRQNFTTPSTQDSPKQWLYSAIRSLLAQTRRVASRLRFSQRKTSSSRDICRKPMLSSNCSDQTVIHSELPYAPSRLSMGEPSQCSRLTTTSPSHACD